MAGKNLSVKQVKEYLDHKNIKFRELTHSRFPSAEGVQDHAPIMKITAMLLQCGADSKVVLYPEHRGLDFALINQQGGVQCAIARSSAKPEHLGGFEIAHMPPLSELLRLPILLDKTIQNSRLVAFTLDGSHTMLISTDDLIKLNVDASKGHFSKLIDTRERSKQNLQVEALLNKVSDQQKQTRRLERQLPAISPLINELIRLKNKSEPNLEQLVRLIETDPGIAATLLRYAASPLYAYQGRLTTVYEAVYHVLGYDFALNIALACAVSAHFRGPRLGPLGRDFLWKHACLSAEIARYIAEKNQLPRTHAWNQQLYLAGLFHHLGYLLMAQWDSAAFKRLNELATQKDDLLRNERLLFAHTHTDVAYQLLSSWGFPLEFCQLVRDHHMQVPQINHTPYGIWLQTASLLADEILGGNASLNTMSHSQQELLAVSGLTENEVLEILQLFTTHNSDISILAKQLAA